MKMTFPDKTKLFLYLRFIEDVIVRARFLSFSNGQKEQIGDLLDAIHNIPECLSDWKEFDEKVLLSFLSTYDKKWVKNKKDFSLLRSYNRLMKLEPLEPNEIILESEDIAVQERIYGLMRYYLKKVSSSGNEGEINLYQDVNDGRVWEFYYLEGQKLKNSLFGLRLYTGKFTNGIG